MKRGEVRWYRFKHPDKKRPVVVLTRDAALDFLNEVTVVAITSTIRDIPSEVFLDYLDGMPTSCAVNCDHIQSIPKGKIGTLITKLSPEKLAQIRAALEFALGFLVEQEKGNK